MNKTYLIKHVAETLGVTKSKAEEAVSAVLGGIEATLVAGEKVQISGFGNFTTKVRPARSGRNPRTGEVIQIAEKTAVSFKAVKKLVEAVNNKA
jgi:nucleoid DNA-binding protein